MTALSDHEWDNDGTLILTGSANAYVAATARKIKGYYEGLRICGQANHTNNGAGTIAVDEAGTVPIRKTGNAALVGGEIVNGAYYDFIYDLANNAMQLAAAGAIGSGSITNAQLADMAAWTVKLRNAGSTGAPSDAALADFTTATPVSGDFCAGFLSTGELRKFNASNFLAGLTAGVQSDMEAASSTAVAVTPGRQHLHPAHSKAWVKYDNNGVLSNDQDYGVTSLTDTGVGLVTVTFDTAFSAATYAIHVTGQRPTTNNAMFGSIDTTTIPTTTAAVVATVLTNGANTDTDYGCASFFGDQ